jgi:molecular chaperone DnaK
MPQIEVTFDIDANGIVNVSAKDKASGKEQQIRIQASGGLSEADIERMVKEAESHAAEDRRRRELIEARNQADAAIYTAEKQLQENGERAGDAARKPVQDAIAALREAMAGEVVERIRQGLESLTNALSRFGEAIHSAAAESPSGAAGASGGGDEGVVDAEFEEVDDPRKRQSG